MASHAQKSPNSVMEGKIDEMVAECLALRRRKLADLYEQKTAQCSLSYLIRHLLRIGKYRNLVDTLRSEDPSTECVLLPRTVDGRIFINGKKYDAQTYFCRLWRFPNLKSRNHLESNENCINSFDDRSALENMCVNPYHFSKPLVSGSSRRAGPRKIIPKPASQNSKSPIKTIIVKNRNSLTTASKDTDPLQDNSNAKRKYPELELEPGTQTDTDDIPTTFKIEARDHPNTLGISMRKLGQEEFHHDTKIFCKDGSVQQNRLLVGLAFPELKQVDVFNFPMNASVYLPDYSVSNIQSLLDTIMSSICDNQDTKPGRVSQDQDTKENIELFDSYNIPDVMEESMEVGKPHTKQLFMPVDSKQGFLGFIEENAKKKIKLEPDIETIDAEQCITVIPTLEKVETVEEDVAKEADMKQEDQIKVVPEKQIVTDTYCFHCNKEFHRKDLYQQHLNLQDHLQYFSESKKTWKCDYCSKAFDTKVTWSAHFGKSGCGKKCEYCSQKFVTTYLWNVHLQRSACGESQKEKIKQDILKNKEFQKCLKDAYNTKGNESFPCKLCNEIFRSFQALFVHNRKSHRNNPIKHISLGQLQNSKSSSEVKDVMSTSTSLSKSAVIHTVGDILSQSSRIKVGGKFSEVYVKKASGEISLMNIKQNIERLKDTRSDASGQANAGEKEKKPTDESSGSSSKQNLTHECLTCGKVFTAIGFENHQLVCGAKDFCEICQKKFMSQSSLFKHISMVHKSSRQAIKTFPCSFCEKKFTAEDYLMFHIEKFHSSKQQRGDANHVCQNCEKAFASDQELRMHQVMTTDCAHLIDASELVKKEINEEEVIESNTFDIPSGSEELTGELSDEVPNVNMNYVDDEILNE